MKKILVPCDFSKPAISAFRYALDIAARSKGSVYLLNVVQLPVLYDTALMPVLNFEQEALEDLKGKVDKSFAKLIQKYNKNGVHVVAQVVFGAASREITEFTRARKIDLIIMGSHGASGAREAFIGSNAEKIVRHSLVPVLVVKDYSKARIRNIVFSHTIDPKRQDQLIQKVKALQDFYKAHLHIVWINTPLNFVTDTETLKTLREFAKQYKFRDYSLHIFNHLDEETGILEFTSSIGGDLIALGTHGRKGINHLINGSIAEGLVNHSRGLVWTYSMKNTK